MAFRYYSNRKEADRAADRLFQYTGYSPSIFYDTSTKSYRVQEDRLGNERFDQVVNGEI